METPKFTSGQLVTLAGNLADGWVEETAEVLEYQGDGMYMVRILEEEREPDDLDGLREVDEKYMSKIS